VAEEGAYAAELGGQPKRKETFGELLRARSVLRRRFGRVYLRVGEPIRCSGLVDGAQGLSPWSERTDAERKMALQQVGDRIIHRIGRAMVVLPTTLAALSLLAHHRRGVPDADLRARARRLHAYLTRAGLPMAASLGSVDEGVSQAMDRFVRDGRVHAEQLNGQRVWLIPPTQRITLDFYKNQVVHAFVDGALAAAAARALPDGPFRVDDLVPGVVFLRALLMRELVGDPDATAAEAVAGGVADLVAHGALSEVEGRLMVIDPVRIGEIHALLRGLLETTLIVATRAPQLTGLTADGWVKRLQDDRDALLASGPLTRPEALLKDTLHNAIETMVGRGVLLRDGDTIHADSSAASALVDTLRPMVGG